MDFGIVSALIIMGGLGLLFGVGLAIASRVFMVKKDARIQRVEDVLPGINCGACGAPGCAGFAEGVVDGKYEANGCTVGGAEVAAQVAEIMGTEAGDVVRKIAAIRCQGGRSNSTERALYQGVPTCRAATLISEGAKGCVYGCLGFGDCVTVCQFDAIYMGPEGLPVVIDEKCTGCGKCVTACPRQIIELIPDDQKVYLGCVSKNFGKAVKSVCKVGCTGCSICANPKFTPNEVIVMDGKLPILHYGKVKDPEGELGMAIVKCPANCYVVRDPDFKLPEIKKPEKKVAAE